MAYPGARKLVVQARGPGQPQPEARGCKDMPRGRVWYSAYRNRPRVWHLFAGGTADFYSLKSAIERRTTHSEIAGDC